MVGSQVVQIAQQMQTNRNLKNIHDHQLSQAEAEARLSWIKDQVLIVQRNLELAETLLESDPAQAYFICERDRLFLHREGISSKSFNDLASKEYFNQLWRYVEDIITHARASLSDETANQALGAAISYTILPQLRGLTAWTQIAELLPGGILKNRYSDWQKPSYRWTVIIFSAVAFFPLLIFPIYLWLTNPYPKVLPRIRHLAQGVGGWVSDHVKQKEAMQIADQHRAVLMGWGMNFSSEGRDLQETVASAEQMIADFTAQHLQLTA